MNETANTPQKINLNDLLSFQQGAVVSKVLLKKNTGNITHFAFGGGEGLSEHTAPFDAFVHITEGEAEIIISGKTCLLGRGEAIVMPAGEPHSLKAITDFKMILVMIKSE
ncbi:MAG: cupin domain-containing protein [Ignavibacteria bacterium]|nr:cupin domain-containing protein [Ignavibacteria bacterium]